ncbi:MAG: iron-sulfur cluster repair di-iron protein [Myxococcaceae bacterium]|nr:iron-sulfur cluster repair di-iron protein [Myxococcaceae bacterium]
MEDVSIHERQPVAQIVLDHPECASVFRQHRIDYCCRGEQSLDEACRQREVGVGEVMEELKRAIATRRPVSRPDDPRLLDTEALIERIVRRHHGFLREALPFLVPLAKKVARVHGAHNAHLLDVHGYIEELSDLLLPHLDREEEVLFPALLGHQGAGGVETIASEVASLHEDHLQVAELLERLRNAAHDFTVPEWACTSYTTLMRELSAVEADVFAHVHLENHVLLPRYARG